MFKYAYVPSPGYDSTNNYNGNKDCWGPCTMFSATATSSPNNNPAADGMASVLAHEIVEAGTDPQGNAWYDRSGYENGDKCAWTFGAQQYTSTGAPYNVKIGSLNYLIQQNWLATASRNGCALHA